MTSSAAAVLCVCVLAAGGGACASSRGRLTDRSAVDRDSALDTYIAKVRRVSKAAVVVRREASPSVESVESKDPGLRDSLQQLAAAADGPANRHVAQAYYRLGILDAAHRYFKAAIDIDRHDAVAHDGVARIWRDWGSPELGLGDANRAIYFAPRSAAAWNTFGTLLMGSGRPRDARRAFERAAELDPGAAYALNNLCYLAFLDGETSSALKLCRDASDRDPQLRAAHNNAALVYASRGDDAGAVAEFTFAGDEAAQKFNAGIALEAGGRFDEATGAYRAAAVLRPSWKAASDRAHHAERLAARPTPAEWR